MLAALRWLLISTALVINGPARADPSDETAISVLLHSMFDKPDALLRVSPVVVSGDHAIADWVQGDMGGRALLRRKQQTWALILCAGDAIKTSAALARAGVPTGDAGRLEQELAAAEAKLAANDVAMFSRFEGLVMMDAHNKAHH